MSERNKPHLGRDRSGHRKVRAIDVEELITDGPEGVDHLQDDVRLGGAVEDVSADAGQAAAGIGDMIADNAEDVARATGKRVPRKGRARSGSRGSPGMR